MNFIALALFGAFFGTAQQSRFSSPWFQLIAAGTPAAWIAAMRPFHTDASTTSRSLSICTGTAPVSHHFTTLALILS